MIQEKKGEMIREKGEETLTVEIVIIIVKEIISQVDTIEGKFF